MTLGLTMIVKNESDVLSRALEGMVGVADEMIVVDTGSTDGTADIAKRFTDKVYSFEWRDDFSAARNFALSKLTADYWIWLDADDIVPERTARAIKRYMKNAGGADVVMMPYVLGVDGAGKPKFSFNRERILRRTPDLFWRGRVHEAVAPVGNVEYLKSPIIHAKPEDRSSGTRNLDIYRGMSARGEKFEPRERYYYARELFYNGFYADAEHEFTEFTQMNGGYAPNRCDACVMIARCRKRRGDIDGALAFALDALAFGSPSGEVCCEIAGLFFEKGDFPAAAYWYKCATAARPDKRSGAFFNAEYCAFIPFVWLAVCYDRMGDIKKAYAYHLKAKKLRPNDPSVEANQAYFDTICYNGNG